MTDATILIPTHRHTALLPYAIKSALDQEGASVEVLVLGDGVEDETREIIAGFGDDPRLRFFDLPKGPRHGEASRHGVLREARGRIVSYLSDDDVLLRDHIADIAPMLEDADFAHSATAWIEPDGALIFRPWDTSRPEFAWFLRSGRGSIGLTGAAHTLEAYHRLPYGWRTTPAGLPTDRYMWLQWLDLPGFRGVTSHRLTHLHFPDPMWKVVSEEERAGVLAGWYERSRQPGFREEIDTHMETAIRRGGENSRLQARKLEVWLDGIQSSRTWRAHERLVGFTPLRTLLARRREVRR